MTTGQHFYHQTGQPADLARSSAQTAPSISSPLQLQHKENVTPQINFNSALTQETGIPV